MTIEMLCTSLKVLNLCTLVRWSIKYTQISDTESFFFPFEFREYWNVSFSSDPSFVYLYIHSLLPSPTAEMSPGELCHREDGEEEGKRHAVLFFWPGNTHTQDAMPCTTKHETCVHLVPAAFWAEIRVTTTEKSPHKSGWTWPVPERSAAKPQLQWRLLLLALPSARVSLKPPVLSDV